MTGKPEFVTIREVAKMLGKKVRTIRGWISNGRIDAVKDLKGYRWLVFLDEVERIMREDGDRGNAD